MKQVKKVLMIVILILLLGLSYGFSNKLAALPELNKPSIIEIDGDEIYVLDDVVVKVYSLKARRLLRQFGKKGHGPGELMPNDEIPLQMQLINGQVFVNSQTKFVFFTKSGQVIKEKAFPFMYMQIIPLGKNYAMSKVGFDNIRQIFFRIILYDEKLNELKTIYTSEKSGTLRGTGKVTVPPNFTYMYRGGERLLVYSGRQEDLHVRVFDLEGNPLTPIKIDYQKSKWRDSSKKEIIDWIKASPRFRIVPLALEKVLEFPIYMPVIRNVVAENNRVYVQTYKKKNNLSEFFIFDVDGKLLKRVFLLDASTYKVKMNPDITFTIKNNNYYYLVENLDNEEWELHVSQVK
ncbi:MAG: hypothetical protein JSV88_09965 [Candidatus Aminicenantes bacterium]|nr:MAG: hypothetical protein JSV88_09965 [Candidatus Aminicenantes bacterium]